MNDVVTVIGAVFASVVVVSLFIRADKFLKKDVDSDENCG